MFCTCMSCKLDPRIFLLEGHNKRGPVHHVLDLPPWLALWKEINWELFRNSIPSAIWPGDKSWLIWKGKWLVQYWWKNRLNQRKGPLDYPRIAPPPVLGSAAAGVGGHSVGNISAVYKWLIFSRLCIHTHTYPMQTHVHKAIQEYNCSMPQKRVHTRTISPKEKAIFLLKTYALALILNIKNITWLRQTNE